MTKELLKRIEALEAQGGCDIVFKFMDGEQERKASFKEFIEQVKKPAHWETLPNGARVWDTGFPKFTVCGGNKTEQIFAILDMIEADAKAESEVKDSEELINTARSVGSGAEG